ncbi:helix-turn-helix domain-containing protein [Thermodesulfobacteriota bacterium B35]
MSAHIEPQVIKHNGRPVFAVLPWDEYKRLVSMACDDDDVFFPNDVVKANSSGMCLVRAWREHFGMTQAELARKAGMSQPALARIEKGAGTPRMSTLSRLADAMGIDVRQLVDD